PDPFIYTAGTNRSLRAQNHVHSSVCRRIITPTGPQNLVNRLHDEPFKAFRIRLSNATAIDVLEPGMVIVGPTSAILPTEFVKDEYSNRLVIRWKTTAIGHIVEFSDIDSRANGKGKKR